MRKWLRRLGILLAVGFGFLVLAAAGIYGISASHLRRQYDLEVQAVPTGADPETIAHGKHIAVAIAKCVDCHGPDLGGKVFIDDPAFGRLTASNLTSGKGGAISRYTDALLVRAIRHGIRSDGRSLIIMPSAEFYYLDDADLGALIAYLRSLPPVDRELPATRLGPLARTLYAARQLPDLLPAEMIAHDAPRPAVSVPGVTKEYGRYLATVGGCQGCHGAGFSGGRVPGTPPDLPAAANITPTGIGSWSQADFTLALREGTRPDGTKINPFMPWLYTKEMTDDEIGALWLFVKDLPPRETGTR